MSVSSISSNVTGIDLKTDNLLVPGTNPALLGSDGAPVNGEFMKRSQSVTLIDPVGGFIPRNDVGVVSIEDPFIAGAKSINLTNPAEFRKRSHRSLLITRPVGGAGVLTLDIPVGFLLIFDRTNDPAASTTQLVIPVGAVFELFFGAQGALVRNHILPQPVTLMPYTPLDPLDWTNNGVGAPVTIQSAIDRAIQAVENHRDSTIDINYGAALAASWTNPPLSLGAPPATLNNGLDELAAYLETSNAIYGARLTAATAFAIADGSAETNTVLDYADFYTQDNLPYLAGVTTVNEPGQYQVTAYVNISAAPAVVAGEYNIALVLQQNATEICGDRRSFTAAFAPDKLEKLQLSTVLTCAAGDTITLNLLTVTALLVLGVSPSVLTVEKEYVTATYGAVPISNFSVVRCS